MSNLPNAVFFIASAEESRWKRGKESLFLAESSVKKHLGYFRRYHNPSGLRSGERIYKLTGVTGDVLNWTDVTESFTS